MILTELMYIYVQIDVSDYPILLLYFNEWEKTLFSEVIPLQAVDNIFIFNVSGLGQGD